MSADIVTRILNPLDPDQKAAAGHAGSHLLLLSPAGSGKTTVLAARIALGIGTGSLHPNRILAVTFTNNSAHQLQERVNSLLAVTDVGINPEDMWIGTFHALSARILRNHPHLVGLRPGFRILDSDDAKAVMMRVIRTHSPGLAEIPAELNRETYRLLRLAEVMRPGFGGPRFAVPASDMHLVTAYHAECLALNAVDFAALISHVLEIFSKHPEVLAAWRARFDAILVDEYQDIDVAQHAWLKHLVGERCTITAFADDDQSVYAWRGSQARYVLEFETHWANAKVMQLTRNYRSTPGIVEAGARLIANNRKRRPKTIASALPNTPGIKPIVHYGFRLDTDEAHWIAGTVASALKVGTTPGEIAVLCRLNKLADPIASALAERQIPFALLSETALNERPEVRTALAWLQLAEVPTDDLAFERVATAAPYLIPHRQIDLIAAHARRQSLPIRVCAILKAADGTLPPDTAARLTRLEQKLQQHASLAAAHERLAALLNDADLRSAWHNPDPKSTESSDNLGELAQRLLAFDRVAEYLATAATGAAVSGDDIPKDRVPLMTLHGAKGLQFSYVFIPGLEEETLPSLGRGEPSEERCEEERRLLYVGITRAKRQAILTSAAHRRNRYLQPSRFIGELSLASASTAA
jgi:DNA helicase II / ATP-dependent DNA helicase PcrA